MAHAGDYVSGLSWTEHAVKASLPVISTPRPTEQPGRHHLFSWVSLELQSEVYISLLYNVLMEEGGCPTYKTKKWGMFLEI